MDIKLLDLILKPGKDGELGWQQIYQVEYNDNKTWCNHLRTLIRDVGGEHTMWMSLAKKNTKEIAPQNKGIICYQFRCTYHRCENSGTIEIQAEDFCDAKHFGAAQCPVTMKFCKDKRCKHIYGEQRRERDDFDDTSIKKQAALNSGLNTYKEQFRGRTELWKFLTLYGFNPV